MRKIRLLVSSAFTILICSVVFTVVAINAEEDHQRSCRELGVQCENGQVHEWSKSVYEQVREGVHKVKERISALLF